MEPSVAREELDLSGLPGGELIAQGLRDLEEGRETMASLLVEIGATRLRRVAVPVPSPPRAVRAAELRLYDRLNNEQPAGAYSRYNALIRLLVSLERSLEAEYFRARRRSATLS